MIDVSPLHLENAKVPMLITLAGMVTLVSPLQDWNAEFPILVTLAGIAKTPLQSRLNELASP